MSRFWTASINPEDVALGEDWVDVVEAVLKVAIALVAIFVEVPPFNRFIPLYCVVF